MMAENGLCLIALGLFLLYVFLLKFYITLASLPLVFVLLVGTATLLYYSFSL